MKRALLPALLLPAALLTAQAIPNNPAYIPGPDAQPKPGVPSGRVTQFTFDKSKIFPGTTRAVSVYIPAQYEPTRPACLMVFQDGSGWASPTANAHTPIVLDNLIAEGSIPVTVGIFVDPGVTPALNDSQMARFHRSIEYDGLGDRYARFLIEEVIPEVESRFSLKISTNPDDRSLLGSSSGGIASFVAAWERPDSFHRVISYIGSFAGLRGGDTLSDLIRKVEPKPLRIFMQDGANDQSIYGGSWFQHNQSIAASLEYAGYDVKFVVGTEGHSGRQGQSILPDALRWLWRDYPKPILPSTGGPGVRHYITDFLDPASDWKIVAQGYGETGALAVDKDGTLFFSDIKAAKIYKIAPDNTASVFKYNAPGVTGMAFGPDGKLYAAESARNRIVAWAPDGGETVVAPKVNARDLTITSQCRIYFTEPAARRIGLVELGGKTKTVFEAAATDNLHFPNGIHLTPDEHLIDLSDRDSRWVWSLEIAPDGALRYGMPFHHLESPDDSSVTEAAGMTLDTTGHVFVATSLGIQICDQAGRVVGIVRKPQPGPVTSVAFGGPGLQTLYATAGGKVYARHMRRTGVPPATQVKLPRPQL